MHWNLHINTIVKKANRNLWFIRRMVGPLAPISAKKSLYLALVCSILEYCSIIWHPISRHNLKHIESVQRRATKMITNRPYATYNERLTELTQVFIGAYTISLPNVGMSPESLPSVGMSPKFGSSLTEQLFCREAPEFRRHAHIQERFGRHAHIRERFERHAHIRERFGSYTSPMIVYKYLCIC